MTYDLALVSAREGHAVLLKLDNSAGSLLAHHLDRVLQKSVCFRERKVSGMKMGFAAHAQALPEGRRGCWIWWGKSNLVSEPVRTLDRVVEVPPPVILRHVTESRIDAALRSDSVGPGWEELCDACNLEALLGKAHSSAETGTAGADDDGVILQAATRDRSEPHRSWHTEGEKGGGKKEGYRKGVRSSSSMQEVATDRVIHDVVLAHRGCVLALGVCIAGNNAGDAGSVELRRREQVCNVRPATRCTTVTSRPLPAVSAWQPWRSKHNAPNRSGAATGSAHQRARQGHFPEDLGGPNRVGVKGKGSGTSSPPPPLPCC